LRPFLSDPQLSGPAFAILLKDQRLLSLNRLLQALIEWLPRGKLNKLVEQDGPGCLGESALLFLGGKEQLYPGERATG
jgi:hypothetical protein